MTLHTTRSLLLLAVFFVAATCRASTVTATLNWPTNNQKVIVDINNGDATNNYSAYGFAGAIPWTQTPSGNNKVLNNTFYSFCIELTQDVYIGGTYTYTLQPLAISPTPGTSQTGGTYGMGTAKAGAIERLWNGFDSQISPTGTSSQQLINGAAFQLAIWRIEYDWTAAQTAASLEDFNSGNFRANADSGTSGAAAITLAQCLLGDVFAGAGAYGTEASNIVAITSPDAQDQITQTNSEVFPPAAAPEPTSMCLALVGGLALSVVGYRRRKAKPQGSSHR